MKRIAKRGTLNPRMVRVPAHMVTAVVVDPDQWQIGGGGVQSVLCGEVRVPMSSMPSLEFGIRKFVARRAALELRPGAVVNLGIGVAGRHREHRRRRGHHRRFRLQHRDGRRRRGAGQGLIFGAAWNPECIMSMPSQFDFYHGGGLDMAFLGMGEADTRGNVNVSKLGKRITGSGGFIDISQNAKTMVFCGTFTNGDIVLDVARREDLHPQGRLRQKFRQRVEQITFSGEFATKTGQQVLYITERAVFRLENGRMVLTEIAPGIDLQKDVLAAMEFVPEIAPDLKTMDSAIFKPERMMENNPALFSHFAERR